MFHLREVRFQSRASTIAAPNVMSWELADSHLISVLQSSYCAEKSRFGKNKLAGDFFSWNTNGNWHYKYLPDPCQPSPWTQGPNLCGKA